jgi:hypothetical protein
LYDQYAKHDYHIINIKELEWFTLHKVSKYHSTLINPQTRKATFALFVGVVGSCWLREKGNFNKVFFENTYIDSTFSSVLEDSKFIKDLKKSCHNGVNIGPKNALTWLGMKVGIWYAKKICWTLNRKQQHQNQNNLHVKIYKLQMNQKSYKI